jgi:hypothetical protein
MYVQIYELRKGISKLLYDESIFRKNNEWTRTTCRVSVENYITHFNFESLVHNNSYIKDFLVICDETNNAPWHITKGEFNVDVYIYTNKPYINQYDNIEYGGIHTKFSMIATNIEMYSYG